MKREPVRSTDILRSFRNDTYLWYLT